MVEDVSKKTILVLVILTIVVSVLGTLTVFDAVGAHNDAKMAEYNDAHTDLAETGHVRLTIGEPEVPITGQVSLTINR